MKKIIFIIIFLFFSLTNAAFCTINIQSTGGTTVLSNQVSTPIQMTINNLVSLILTVKVKALDQYITNTTNSIYKIPVSQLYLNDGTSEYRMMYNTSVTTVNNVLVSIGGFSKNYTCTIKNIGVLPPGTYATRLQFDANTTPTPASTVYTLSFEIPLAQSVSSATNPVNITLTPDNVFDNNATIENTTTPQIIVQSNGNWKLILNTGNLKNLLANYYFLITGVSSNVTNYISAQTQLQSNQQYVLASGKATISAPITGNYTTDYINIKYFLKNTSGAYISEGIYNDILNYTIQNGDI